MDCSLLGASVHGILWARILGVGSHLLLQGISQLRDQTRVSHIADYLSHQGSHTQTPSLNLTTTPPGWDCHACFSDKGAEQGKPCAWTHMTHDSHNWDSGTHTHTHPYSCYSVHVTSHTPPTHVIALMSYHTHTPIHVYITHTTYPCHGIHVIYHTTYSCHDIHVYNTQTHTHLFMSQRSCM